MLSSVCPLPFLLTILPVYCVSNYPCSMLPYVSLPFLHPLLKSSKAYPIFYRHGETERSIFNMGFLIGTGFGLAEYVLYVGFLGVPFTIRLPLVFFHSASTSITAFGVARKKTVRLYLAAVGLHFAINFISIVSNLWHIAFLFVFITYYYSWQFYKQTSHNSIVK